MLKDAKPGHRKFLRSHKGFSPVVLSAKHFEGLLYRSQQKEKEENLAAFEQVQRYKEYLVEGGEALAKRFNLSNCIAKDEDQLQSIRDTALVAATKDLETLRILEEQRKERIMRANEILKYLKPGPRVLHQALLQSELIHQRKHYESLNAEIAEDARREERLGEGRCPATLIPFGYVTEQEEKAEQLRKKQEYHDYYVKDLEVRRENQLAKREQEIVDGIIEREQYKCLQEMENKAAKELKEKKQNACRIAHRKALAEKAERAEHNPMAEAIDDRINCVQQVAQRHLKDRYRTHIANMRTNDIKERQARALRIAELQQSNTRAKQQAIEEDQYGFAADVDEARRQCAIAKLAKERKAYQLEEAKMVTDKAIRKTDVRRFEMATRLNNETVNKYFAEMEKAKLVAEKAELRETLLGQRDRFLEQRQEELMRLTACEDEDPYLLDDFKFFNDTVREMEKSKARGRPVYPLARAAERYKRDNQVDLVPERRMLKRSKVRDYCWPGYYSKADLAYRKYEHRETCREKQNKERYSIFSNCIKITKMASEESPYKPCVAECPIKCFHNRGMPAIEELDSFDICQAVCDSNDSHVDATAQRQQPEMRDKAAVVSKPIGQLAIQSNCAINSAAEAVRLSGGKDSLVGSKSATKILKSAKQLPDLARCWTAKPATVQQKAAQNPVGRQVRPKYVWPHSKK